MATQSTELMLSPDFTKGHMSGMPPFDSKDGMHPEKVSPRQHPTAGAGLSRIGGSQAAGNDIDDSLGDMQQNFPNKGSSEYSEESGKRQYQDDIGGSPKRHRGDDNPRKQQMQMQQMQMQQQMQQQQDGQMDGFLGRAWGPNMMVDPAGNFLRGMMPNQQHQQNNYSNSGNNYNQSNLLLDDNSLRRAELQSQLIREQAARNQAMSNAAFLASIGRPIDLLNQGMGGQQGLNWSSQQQFNGLPQGSLNQAQQLAALRSLNEYPNGNLNMNQGNLTPLMGPQGANSERNPELAVILRQMQANQGQGGMQNIGGPNGGPGNSMPGVGMGNNANMGALPDMPNQPGGNPSLELPPCEEGLIESFTKRHSFQLGIDEDPNWLSEFHCFVRSELVEVFRASNEDVKARNNSIAFHQVGVRCRFCAHMTPSARAGRSSAFPSSLRQIYQSFTMMLRDHFGNCDAMPTATQDKFMLLKDKPAQGATDSKRYWMYSAMKIGMTDSSDGIMMNEHTRAVGARSPPFGTNPGQRWEDDAFRSVPLVLPSDRSLVSEFLYVLMSQVQPIRLTEAECIGNRRSLRVGLPGFGCRYCCEHRRLGLCRMFPARRRTLPSKVNDVYDHLRRCTVCPESVKKHLERTKHQMNTGFHADQGGDREFFDRVWSRLGHESQAA